MNPGFRENTFEANARIAKEKNLDGMMIKTRTDGEVKDESVLELVT